jgi:hypothetical protein
MGFRSLVSQYYGYLESKKGTGGKNPV